MRMGVGFAMGLYGRIFQFCYTIHLIGQASLSSSRLVKVGCSDFSKHRSAFLKDASTKSSVSAGLFLLTDDIHSRRIDRKSHTHDWHSTS